ncbi:Solitary outer membrane autotransporter beta-barrel domain [Pseudoalteromonas spongiae]|uniref:Solitary outer membrane autotransporter beta-barrel domain n=1 Tax=Pseudoalteromonas spongiae TaxID=298657 RepID=UPI00373663C4
MRKLVFLLCVFISLPCDASVKKAYEESFASSVVLSDSDVVRFGFGNFDPVNILEQLGDDAGDKSVDLRTQLKVFALPYTYTLDEDSRINTHFSYISQSQEILLDDVTIPDDSHDQIFTAYADYETALYRYDNWLLEGSIGAHVMHYDNIHDYNSPESRAAKAEVEGIYFNTTANSVLTDMGLTLSRRKASRWGHWLVKSSYNHFFGKGFGGDDATRDSTPSGWYFANSVRATIKLDQKLKHTESIYLKFQRVDLGGDARSAFSTGHYYEYGGGLLIDTRPWTSWFDNIGIGLHYNEGSVLSGGSIVIYFNEE